MSDRPTFGGGPHLEYAPGQIVLRVHEGAVRPYFTPSDGLTVQSSRNLPDAVTGPLEYLRREGGARLVEPLFATSGGMRAYAYAASGARLSDRQHLGVIASVAHAQHGDLAGLAVLQVPTHQVSARMLRTVSASPAIAFAEPMPARWLTAAASDPRANRQWGLRAIRWYAAARATASRVVVAVLDTGIDTSHPDLARVKVEYDHAGLSIRDLLGHGTHVSGIIAATTNNVTGVNGIANCKLVVHKVFPDQPASDGNFYVDGDRYLRALNAVIDAKTSVLNLSLGGTAPSQTEQLLFNRLEKYGVTVVAAMGNEFEAGNPVEYPAAYENVFAVGATTEMDRRATFSNTGRHIQLVAPGSNIVSTLPTTRAKGRDETGYGSWSGTSMATPHVAAAAALLAAKHPDWGPHEIKKRLVDTARKLDEMKGRAWTQAYGSGLLDLEQALS